MQDRRNSGHAEGGLAVEGDPSSRAVGGSSGGGGGYTIDGQGGGQESKSFLNGAVGGSHGGAKSGCKQNENEH